MTTPKRLPIDLKNMVEQNTGPIAEALLRNASDTGEEASGPKKDTTIPPALVDPSGTDSDRGAAAIFSGLDGIMRLSFVHIPADRAEEAASGASSLDAVFAALGEGQYTWGMFLRRLAVVAKKEADAWQRETDRRDMARRVHDG